jgi:hypothetical protein
VTNGTDVPDPDPKPPPGPGHRPSSDEVRRWTDDKSSFLSAPTALSIRKWICETLVSQLQNGPHGVAVRKIRGKNEWRIGSHSLYITDVRIERAYGGGTIERANPFSIDATDENAALVRGILAVTGGGSLDHGGVEWSFHLQTRISDYAAKLAGLAAVGSDATLPSAVEALTVMRHVSVEPGQTVRTALTPMLTPTLPQLVNPAVRDFLRDASPIRDEALTALRNHATAAKGAGNPSVLDAGLLHRDIQSRLSARAVSGPPDSLLGRLQAIQARAFSRAWALAGSAFRTAERVLDPGEDLTATLAVVDRLVSAGHSAGMLPRADFRASYDEARSQIPQDSMAIYRQLAMKMAQGTGPADIWDICDDPVPRLAALTRYADVVNELFNDMADKIASAPDAGSSDTGAVIEAFRELADLLDELARSGGR